MAKRKKLNEFLRDQMLAYHKNMVEIFSYKGTCPKCGSSDISPVMHERENYPLTFWKVCEDCDHEYDIRNEKEEK